MSDKVAALLSNDFILFSKRKNDYPCWRRQKKTISTHTSFANISEKNETI